MGKILSGLCFPVHVDKPNSSSEVEGNKKVANVIDNKPDDPKENYSDNSFCLTTPCEGIKVLLNRH